MALDQVTVYTDQIAAQRIGYQAISLTHFDDTAEPQITAGSVVEIGGALFEAAALESITGWSGISNDSDVYIKLVVSGATATAEFTDTPPAWDTEKQGWYDGDDRYIGGLYKDGSGNYIIKWLYPQDPGDPINQEMIRDGETRPLLDVSLDIGDWNLQTNASVDIDALLSAANIEKNKVRQIQAVVRNDANTVRIPLSPQGYYLSTTVGFEGILVYRSGSDYIAVRLQVSDHAGSWAWALLRVLSGSVSYADWDSTSYNRGWLHLRIRA